MCHAMRLSRTGTYPMASHWTHDFTRSVRISPIKTQNPLFRTDPRFARFHPVPASAHRNRRPVPHSHSSRSIPALRPALHFPPPWSPSPTVVAPTHLPPWSPRRISPTVSRRPTPGSRPPTSRSLSRLSHAHLLTRQSLPGGTPSGSACDAPFRCIFPPLCTTGSDLRICLARGRWREVWAGVGGAVWSRVERGGVSSPSKFG